MYLLYDLLALLTLTSLAYAKPKPKAAMLLSTVQTLTLRDGRLTSHRRVAAMPQLTCVGGNAKGLYSIDVMRCENSGTEYGSEDIQWTCKADLPGEFKLGSTDVICEGYDHADDPYVLKGSCGVEYRLILTKLGEERYGRSAFDRAWRKPNKENVSSALFTMLFWGTFISVALFIIYKVLLGGDGGMPRLPPNRGFDPFDPRGPPPGPPPPGNDYKKPDGPWRPGFWSGAAAAAAGAYAANAYRNSQRDAGPSSQQRARYYDEQPSWLHRERTPSPPRANYGSGRNRGSSSFGGNTYESTGFGGTRRR
ncbi:hypothetical protein K470DRAFT_276614 [Piedraia hortae CBS 480.64]|uniref:Store-operated calcium entry-associated regulatory factor n=1 Tax=Piedraia hortae CBS 480.64 TaxID=1314780 RepID=A0A6A7C1Q7_9PEZI|nr:hypothetical protein K470DRAFT_276614 [Piedraia hortae CBS 480.64]